MSARLNIPQLIKFGLHLGCQPKHIHRYNHFYSVGNKNSNVIINLSETCLLLRKFIFFTKKLVSKEGLIYIYNSPAQFGKPVKSIGHSSQILKTDFKNGCLSNFDIQKKGTSIHKLSNKYLSQKVFSSNPFHSTRIATRSYLQKDTFSPSLVFFPRLDDNSIALKNTKRGFFVSSSVEDLSYLCGISDFFIPANNRSSASIFYFSRLFWNIAG